MNLCLVANLHVQSFQNNADIVKRVYESFENNDKSTLTAELLSTLKEQNTEMAFDFENSDRFNISLSEIIENRWEKVTINNLNIQELEENKVLASGEFSDSQLTECEFITTKFIHEWSIQNDIIITFKERTNNKNHAITKN